MKNTTIDPDMAIIRAAFPRLRRGGPVAIVHSGGRRTCYRCLCGAWHTVATRNRGTTKHEREFQAEHSACAARIAEEIRAGRTVDVVIGKH
jgi:hypothetical protein